MSRSSVRGSLGLAVAFVVGCSVTPTPSPSSSQGPAEPCPIVEQSGPLSSDRLVDVRVTSGPTGDTITFVLGERSAAPTAPNGRLRAVTPPFSAGGSGLPVDVPGSRHVEIRLEGMFLYDDAGTPAYDGPRRFDPTGPVLRALASIDEFEGHSTWIAGFDGVGCVALEAGPVPGMFVVSLGR